MPLDFWKRKPEWRSNPGAFERHLQLRYNNPIFPAPMRTVSNKELDEARSKDQQAADEFNSMYLSFMQQISTYEDQIPFDKVSQTRDRIDELLDLAATVGSNVIDPITKLMELRRVLTDTAYEALAENELKDTYTNLQHAERFNRSGRETFRNPFVAQIRNIPAEELIPRLLSEDVEVIRTAMKALNDSAIKAIQVGSITRFKEILQEINNPDDSLIDELITKLEAMGINPSNS